MRYIRLVVCLVATLSTAVAFAQAASTLTDPTVQDSTSSPVAYVYVSNSYNRYVHAFATAPNGKLTPVSGSPFLTGYAYSMAVNAKYLFVTDTVYIRSFSIAPDGAIKKVASINAQHLNDGGCGGPGAMFFDRTGATVYDVDFDEDCSGTDDAYQFFHVDSSTGKLGYFGVTPATWSYFVPLSFIGNNLYAYASECSEYSYILGFQRNNDETLTDLNINPSVPTAPKGYYYCPNQAVADPTHHVAIALTPTQGYGASQSAPPPQLATYTADSSGNLTTKSTRFNMPKTAMKILTDIAMSPSGKLLAVAGTTGLQVFHFNGSRPITHFTGLLTGDQVDQLFWDNHNHLYATSQSTGKLFVFTVTPTGVSQAPGSPHRITKPQSIVVLSKK